MTTEHVKSSKSAKLYIVAAIFLFIQAGALMFIASLLTSDYFANVLVGICAVFGIVYLIGAFFARTGTGVTATTYRPIGGGWYQQGTETANAITCGCMSGIGSLGLTIYSVVRYTMEFGPMVIPGGIPGFIGSLLAIYAGGTALMASRSKPSDIKSGRTCSYCGKVGLSPEATACPSCGQPL